MNKNNKKGSKSSRKNSTKVGKSKLPTNISRNSSGTYRVRKTMNGTAFDRSFTTLKDAKAILSAL